MVVRGDSNARVGNEFVGCCGELLQRLDPKLDWHIPRPSGCIGCISMLGFLYVAQSLSRLVCGACRVGVCIFV